MRRVWVREKIVKSVGLSVRVTKGETLDVLRYGDVVVHISYYADAISVTAQRLLKSYEVFGSCYARSGALGQLVSDSRQLIIDAIHRPWILIAAKWENTIEDVTQACRLLSRVDDENFPVELLDVIRRSRSYNAYCQWALESGKAKEKTATLVNSFLAAKALE